MGSQLLRLKVSYVVEQSRNQSELHVAGVQSLLIGPGNFWVFNAQMCILPHSRDSFILTSTSITKADKNRTLDCTSINLRYFYTLIPIFQSS